MLYLFTKILFCLALAAGLGGVIGWLLRGSGRREQIAEIESGWRRRLDTTDKERLALAVERDRLVRENASIKSLHSDCRPRVEALEAEIEAARQAHDAYDEEVTRLKLRLQVAEEELEGESKEPPQIVEEVVEETAEEAAEDESAVDQTAPQEHEDEDEQPFDFDLDLPAELEPAPDGELDEGAASSADTSEQEAPAGPAAIAGLLEQPDGEADDLKKVKGIGRVLEKTLNELGIFHFRQLARLNDEEAAWVAESIQTFPDRIKRDRWVEQAADLHEKKYGEKP